MSLELHSPSEQASFELAEIRVLSVNDLIPMLMADDGWSLWSGGDVPAFDEDGPSIDLEVFYNILGEKLDPMQGSPEDISQTYVSQSESAPAFGNHETSLLQNSAQESDGDWSLNDWVSQVTAHDIHKEKSGVCEIAPSNCIIGSQQSESGIPNATIYSFRAGTDIVSSTETENEIQLFPMGRDANTGYVSSSLKMDLPQSNIGMCNVLSRTTDISSDFTSGICRTSDVYDTSENYSAVQYCMNPDETAFSESFRQYMPDSFRFQYIPSSEEIVSNISDEVGGAPTVNKCLNEALMINVKDEVEVAVPTENKSVNKMILEAQIDIADQPMQEAQMINYFDIEGVNSNCEGSSGNSSSNADNILFIEKPSIRPFLFQESTYSVSEKQAFCMKAERNEVVTTAFTPFNDDDTDRHSYISEHFLPCGPPSSSYNELACMKDEKEGKSTQYKIASSHFSGVVCEAVHSDSSDHMSQVDDDMDICILEEISQPARSNCSLAKERSIVTSQRSTFAESNHIGGAGVRLKSTAERLIFQVALQDLSQPKSEASLPDGVLAVPLLRHQRIALSWMIQKETAGLNCLGGILADDQGLGKTISTIALILKERSPSSKICRKDKKECQLETLNLDDEEDDSTDLDGSSQNKSNSCVQTTGRPAAGTLVVCPTSVLRQWADELHNKVASNANLSVLVYHGSNRTKDPSELAKYDVVLTTYSIVSMEVPKQPLVDKDDDEKVKSESHVTRPIGLPTSKKRKYPPSSGQRRSKDSELLESVSRPLARVGWFRVVLDEAQSIKNHRTQVARACWGLRAKRRWCLSGTPIQNAVDDLYSYFRFLRYDPFAVYKAFCSSIKVPISRNPTNGYKKLQAVLRTIMLRRTKGTLLDGEPIINLPPKSIELKKVAFTKEERDFYSKLEADSRAQFEEYAAAGTVKQNYVNILLMLLRLRQACDHPLLVKGYDSCSAFRSCVEVAKKLPQEQQISLLNCLEASLAICGICNDPPEDAVVTICGHVFCNQCICEHLTGDDNQCPNAKCKVQLLRTSVFSKATLRTSLSNQSTDLNGPPDCSSSSESTSSDLHSFDSSKIKAALEVLQSISYGEISCVTSSDGVGGFTGSVRAVGEKAIVFSQWTRMLDLLEGCLKKSSIQYRRLDGTMSIVARDKAVKDFNTLPEVSVMIMSLKAASLGLNMVAACHVLLLDLWWNPTTEDQAIDRAHRIGQTRPVTVLRLTVKDTVEDRILALQQKKREMVASAFGEDEKGSRQSRLTVEDLKYLFMV